MSKNTKTRILASSLKLFNEQGLAKITLRTIAQDMGISQGNLNYHFKKREAILEALYFELVQKMDNSVASLQLSEINLKNFYDLSRHMMLNFYEYRFFMLDFVQIIRDNTTIKEHYAALSQMRKVQFIGIFQLWIDADYMRQEEFEGEFEGLYLRMHIIGDFWASTAYNKQELNLEHVDKYCMASIQGIYPYLTAKGKEEFKALLIK